MKTFQWNSVTIKYLSSKLFGTFTELYVPVWWWNLRKNVGDHKLYFRCVISNQIVRRTVKQSTWLRLSLDAKKLLNILPFDFICENAEYKWLMVNLDFRFFKSDRPIGCNRTVRTNFYRFPWKRILLINKPKDSSSFCNESCK